MHVCLSPALSTHLPFLFLSVRGLGNGGKDAHKSVHSVDMASRKKRSRTSFPSQESGQRLISDFFQKKNDPEVTAEGAACETSGCGETSNQTSTLKTSTSSGSSGTTKLADKSHKPGKNSISSHNKSSKETEKTLERDDKFSQLSKQIMENIFCQLPFGDLMLKCALVCRRWHEIITDNSVSDLPHFN